jgi:hypothetical protein
LHDLHSQMPTAFLLTASLPQNVHVYLSKFISGRSLQCRCGSKRREGVSSKKIRYFGSKASKSCLVVALCRLSDGWAGCIYRACCEIY